MLGGAQLERAEVRNGTTVKGGVVEERHDLALGADGTTCGALMIEYTWGKITGGKPAT